MNQERLYQILPKLYDAMRKDLGRKKESCGLYHGQPRILDFLYRNDGCMQREFCDEFSLEASTISNLLVSMEKDGLLRRERSPLSPRMVNVYITEEGKKVQKKLEHVYDQLEEQAFRGISQEEQEQILAVLQKITGNFLEEKS